jgi:hypothetical protein
MPPILDRSPIPRLSDCDDLKSQLTKPRKPAPRIDCNLMTPPQHEPPKLRVNLLDHRTLMSSVRRIERRHRRRIATFPGSLPSLNPSTNGHNNKLTPRPEQWKRRGDPCTQRPSRLHCRRPARATLQFSRPDRRALHNHLQTSGLRFWCHSERSERPSVILSEASAPFVIVNEGSDATAGKDLGQLRGSEAGTGFESLLPN